MTVTLHLDYSHLVEFVTSVSLAIIRPIKRHKFSNINLFKVETSSLVLELLHLICL